MSYLFNKYTNVIWAIARVWFGIDWMTHGIEKITKGFDSTGFLNGVLANEVSPEWYKAFIENVILPMSGFINFLIPVGELLVGLALILGFLTIPALVGSLLMNLNFLWAGVISSNPSYVAIAIILLLGWRGIHWFGKKCLRKNRWIKMYKRSKKIKIAHRNVHIFHISMCLFLFNCFLFAAYVFCDFPPIHAWQLKLE